MSNILALTLAIFVGALTSIQSAVNTELGKYVGGVGAAFVSFIAGTMALAAGYLIFGEGGIKNLGKAPVYLWFGGLLGAVFVFSMIILLPAIGADSAIAGVIAGQLLLAVVIDQFGLFGMTKTSLSWPRVLGAVFLLVGVKLMGK